VLHSGIGLDAVGVEDGLEIVMSGRTPGVWREDAGVEFTGLAMRSVMIIP
jgi:hypothetical protein